MTSDPNNVPPFAITGSNVDTRGGDIVGHDKVGQDNVGRDKLVIENAFFEERGARQPHVAGALFGRPPRLLPYLTDRNEQLRRLTIALQAQIDRGTNRPLTFFAVGCEDDCLDSFVEQVRFVRLPDFLKSNSLPPEIKFGGLRWPSSDTGAELLDGGAALELGQVTDQVHDVFSVKTTADKSVIEQKLENTPISCLLHVGMRLADWGRLDTALMSAWLRWLTALNLGKVRNPFVTLITIIYPSGFYHRLWSQGALAALRRDIRLLSGDEHFGPTVHALPELGAVRLGDVEQWIREYVEDVDREVLRRLVSRHFSYILGFGERPLSMRRAAEVVKDALRDPSVRMSTS